MLSERLTGRRVVAVIGDLVDSRGATDRAALQARLRAALDAANTWAAAGCIEPLVPTVGDEFQGVYDNRATALDATLLVRASMPVPHDVRFGIGVGSITWAEEEPVGGFRRQDGPAWWAARDAIDHVATVGSRRDVPRTLRTWAAALPQDADPRARIHQAPEITPDGSIQVINAYLAVRDHAVSRMDARDRRILQHLLLGRSVAEIAEAESITSSAVSQRIQRSGAAAILYSRDQLHMALLGREGDT